MTRQSSKRESKRGVDWPRVARTILMLALAIGGVIAAVIAVRHEQRVAPRQVLTEVEVEQVVADTSALMPDLIVTKQPMPIIERDSRDRVLTWLVEAKQTNEYFFDVTKYEIENGGDFNYAALGDAINRAYTKHTSFPDEISVNVGLGTVVTGGLSVPVKTLMELLGLVHEVVELRVDHVEIAIKGYADGEMSPAWRRKIKPLPDEYHAFPVLRASNEEKRNWLFYRMPEQRRTVSDPYTNDDLPDLRAEFLRREFVEQVVNHPENRNRDRCRVYVLHNTPLRDANKAEFRKAQVYVMVYLAQT